jgi:hypothetical protein
MNRQPHSEQREIIVARAVQEFVSELRMIDVADYIAFIRLERFANLADIVDSAAELYFHPGTLKLGHGGEAHVDWGSAPRILLDMELRPRGATVYFTLTLTELSAAIAVNFVSFQKADPDPDANTRFLEQSLAEARIVRSAPPPQLLAGQAW